MKKKKTTKSTTPSILNSENWISQSSVAGNLARAQDAPPPNSSDSPDLCNLSFLEKCVAVPWTDTQYNGWLNLEVGACQTGDVTWAIEGDADGTTMPSNGIFKFGAKGEINTISATCMGKKVRMTLVYVKAELLQVEFVNAASNGTKRNILTDEPTKFIPNGARYNPLNRPLRGWMAAGPINNPVAVPFSKKLTLSVTVEVTPAKISFAIRGQGIPNQFGDLIWNKLQVIADGKPQVLVMEPAGDLPQSVGITKGSINWEITAAPCPRHITLKTIPDKSGEHEIFRTLGETNPPGIQFEPAEASIARMRKICTIASGKENRLDVMNALNQNWPKRGKGKPPKGTQGNLEWRVFDGFDGDCFACAVSFSQACLLLGIGVSYKKICGAFDNNCLDPLKRKDAIINGEKKVVTLLFATEFGKLGEIGNGPLYNEFQTMAYFEEKSGDKIKIEYWDVNSTNKVYASSCDAFNAITNKDAPVFKAQYWVLVPKDENPDDYVLIEDAPFKTLQCDK